MKKDQVAKAQQFLQKEGIDGWLLYDFAKNNPLLYQLLGLPSDRVFRRRMFYWIPARGEPHKIVHSIESHVLDACVGTKKEYSSWQTLYEELAAVLHGKKKVAMEYSPRCDIPYIAKVDAGTVELVESFGPKVVSSANFLPYFTAILDRVQVESCLKAGEVVDRLVADAWKWIRDALEKGKKITEYDVQQKIASDFAKEGMVTDTLPNVSARENTADPHYLPEKNRAKVLQKGDFLLIDMWCREKGDNTIFADITRVAVAAKEATERQKEIFSIVRKAQVAATEFVRERMQKREVVQGFEVDDVARGVIQKAGYGPQFLHRTGHNIGVELHGSGAHIDNLEMHDTRPILPGTCFSIEPGIYFPGDFGIRLEYDVFVDLQGHVHIVGGEEEELLCLFS